MDDESELWPLVYLLVGAAVGFIVAMLLVRSKLGPLYPLFFGP